MARRRARQTVIFLVGALALYFGGVLVLGAIPVNADFEPAADGIELCVRSNGVHADFVVPAASEAIDWRSAHPASHFPKLERETSHIAFGWGNRRFYLETPTWDEFRLTTGVMAISGIGDSALHVEYVDRPHEGERAVCTRVDRAQYDRIARYIQTAFKRDAGGAVIRIDAPGYGAADAFYEARGTFSLFVTCNEWVAQGLGESGIRAPAWSPFDGALLRQLRAANRQ